MDCSIRNARDRSRATRPARVFTRRSLARALESATGQDKISAPNFRFELARQPVRALIKPNSIPPSLMRMLNYIFILSWCICTRATVFDLFAWEQMRARARARRATPSWPRAADTFQLMGLLVVEPNTSGARTDPPGQPASRTQSTSWRRRRRRPNVRIAANTNKWPPKVSIIMHLNARPARPIHERRRSGPAPVLASSRYLMIMDDLVCRNGLSFRQGVRATLLPFPSPPASSSSRGAARDVSTRAREKWTHVQKLPTDNVTQNTLMRLSSTRLLARKSRAHKHTHTHTQGTGDLCSPRLVT